MKKGLKIGLIVIGALVVIGTLANLGKKDGKDTVTTSSDADKAKADSLAAIQADSVQRTITITPENLVGLYKENEIKADKDFKDKEFYVKGTIKSISKDVLGHAFITLGSENEINSVQCYFESEEALAELSKGQLVTVKGVCNGYVIMNVLMKECTLAKNLN